MRITREEYQEYLRIQRGKRGKDTPLNPIKKLLIDRNQSDLKQAFIGTNINAIEI